MKDAYKKLYDMFSKKESLSNLSYFVAVKGERYDNNKTKLMLIGRAPNGWEKFDSIKDGNAFAERVEQEFQSTGRCTKDPQAGKNHGWIENRNGVLYSGNYCVSSSPFWRYSKEIWEKLQPSDSSSDGPVWMENIVWSNLYKISPAAGGNPDNNLMDLQRRACIEILEKEIAACEPTHILIMSGYDWFKPFISVFQNTQENREKNVARGKDKNNVFVEGYATYKGAKVVIACRPDFREKKDYVAAVLDCFRKEPNENIFG